MPSRMPRRAVAKSRNRRAFFETLESRQLLAAFTAGNLLVSRIGNGTTPVNENIATVMFLDEVTPAGDFVQTIALPTSDSGANQTLTGSPIGQAEGLLSVSADGQYALIAGYDAPLGTLGLTSTLSSTIARVVARVDSQGNVDTTTRITDGFSPGTVRSVVSTNGNDLWVSGGTTSNTTGGIRHTTLGSTGASLRINANLTATRGLTIADGQLYVTNNTETLRIGQVGTGTPTTAGQTVTSLPGIPNGSFGNNPYQFFFADLSAAVPGVDTLYIADATVGLSKFSLVGGSWQHNGSIARLGKGLVGITGRVDGSNVTIFGVNQLVGTTELVTYQDTTGHTGTISGQLTPTSYSLSGNFLFRGVSYVPQAVPPAFDPNPSLATGSGNDEIVLRRDGNNLVVTVGGTPILTQALADTVSLVINGEAGNDRLTVDYGGGDPIPVGGVTFHGGTQSGAPGDTLAIVGTGTQNATYAPNGTANPSLDNDGTVTVDGKAINFTGLEPLDMIGMAVANVVFPNGNDIISLDNGLTSGGAAAVVVSGTSGGVPFESVALRNNTLVNISTNSVAGVDTVTIVSSNNAHGNMDLQLTTGGEAGDAILVTGPATFAGSASLSSQSINFSAAASVLTAGTQVTLNSGAGAISDGTPATPSVLAATLSATAGSGITLGTNVATLSAAVTAAGALAITEANAVTLQSVTTANGAISIIADGAVVAENVNSGAQSTALSISGGGLTSGPADPGVADIIAGTLTITLSTAGNNVGTSPANRLEINVTQLQVTTNTAAQNNAYILDTAGGLAMNNSTVGGVPGSMFDILVQNGSLTTVNDGTRDVGADIIVLAVTGAGSTIGNSSANQLEINAVSSLTATSAGGGIFLDDTDANLPVALVDASGGNVDLRSALGDILSVAGDAGVPDVVGSTINLRLGTAGNTLGTSAANRLEINGSILQIFNTGANNNYFLVDTAGGLQVNASTTGGGGASIFDLLVQNGNLTGGGTGVGDVRADVVIVAVTGAANTIGTSAASPLEINANNSTTATSAGGNIFLRDIATDFPLGLINAGTGNADLRTTVGAITDANGAANNVVASNLAMRAMNGIGSLNAIETAVSGLSAENSTSGSINVDNSVGGLLTLLNLPPVVAGFAVRNLGGNVSITNASPLTVANNISASGMVVLTALDSAVAGDDLTINANVTVESTGSLVSLNVGDNLTLSANARLAALSTIMANVDLGVVDVGTGAIVTIPASADIDAASFTIFSGDDSDTFHIAPDGDGGGPDIDTPITINASNPTVVPGDVLNLDITGLGVPTLLVGPGPNDGVYTFAAVASVTYTSIETVNAGGGAANLVIDLEYLGFQDGVANDIFVRMDATGTDLLIDVDGAPVFAGAAAGVNSLTIIGCSDDDRLRIDETTGGLPQFLGQTPAVNNVGIGGGIANPSHLGPSADQILETIAPAGTPWDASDVTIHFDGRTGVDSIDLNLITVHQVAYTSDTLDSANSGNLGTVAGANADFLMSFANLAPLNLSGAGGVLLLDASGTPTTSLTLSDDGIPADGWSQVAGDGGFETTRFRGFSDLLVAGGNGSQLVDQVGLDSATTLTNTRLYGGNTSDLLSQPGGDLAGDTLRVRSTPATVNVLVRANAGDDLIQLFDAANTVDNIQNLVAVFGDAGNNTLTVIDSGDVGPDTVLITQTSIEGITGFAVGLDILYNNIDVLNVTATQGADTLDASFAPGSDLDTVNLSGWTGSDQFYLTTTDEQIGGTATGIQTINLYGDAPGNPNANDGNDIFGETPPSLIPGTVVGLGVRMIRNSISTLINIDGGRPTAAPNPPVGDQIGDVLNLDTTALLPPVIVATLGANPSLPGVAQSIAAPPSHRPVNFIEIEDINLVDRGILTDVEMGDLFIRGSNAVDNVSFAGTIDPNVARVRVNAYQNFFTVTRRTVVYALGGNDYVQMGNFNRVAEFYGGDGDDYLTGYNQADKLVGGIGRDRINAGQGNNVVWGDQDPVEVGLPDIEANRQLMASMPFNPQLGEALYADILSTLDGADTVYGGPGIDQITTAGGVDYAYGGQGNDTISGGAGNDRLYGGEGNDNLNGGGDHDLLSGGGGNDVLNAVSGNDVLIGGAGNDSLFGDVGNDALFDGLVTVGGGTSDSQTIGDAADLAMQALLADWLADLAIGLAFTNDHAGTDSLRGGLNESDTFSTDNPAEILDFELALDTLLP